MDIFGNTLLRPASQTYLLQKSRVLSEMVNDFSYCKKRAAFVDLDRLKFKDRDRLDDQFVFWRSAKDKFMVIFCLFAVMLQCRRSVNSGISGRDSTWAPDMTQEKAHTIGICKWLFMIEAQK